MVARPSPAAPQHPLPPSGRGDFAEKLQAARPLLAGYLSGAKSTRTEGNKLIYVFEDRHFAQPLIDAKQTLDQIAAPMQVVIEIAEASGPAAKKEEGGTLRDDPVVKAFAKHLGGEVVREKR